MLEFCFQSNRIHQGTKTGNRVAWVDFSRIELPVCACWPSHGTTIEERTTVRSQNVCSMRFREAATATARFGWEIRRKQKPSVRVVWRFENFPSRPVLDYPPAVKYGDTLTEAPGEGQIVRDEQHGQAGGPSQPMRKRQDLTTH